MKMTKRLTGKVALVTGGASGIGWATVEKLAQEGAQPIIADCQAPAGSDYAFVQTDVTDPESVAQAVAFVVAQYGHLDIAVANAGITEQKAGVADVELDNWQRVLDVDLTGVMLTDKYAARQMLQQAHGGSIINLSSILGVVGAAKSQAYSAAKAAVANLTRSQAVTYGKAGVRFNAVAPGYVATPLLKTLPAEVTDAMVAKMPIGRLGQANEVAKVIAFLASDEASLVSSVSMVATPHNSLVSRGLPRLFLLLIHVIYN